MLFIFLYDFAVACWNWITLVQHRQLLHFYASRELAEVMLAAWIIHNEGIYAMEISQHHKSSIVLSSNPFPEGGQ